MNTTFNVYCTKKLLFIEIFQIRSRDYTALQFAESFWIVNVLFVISLKLAALGIKLTISNLNRLIAWTIFMFH